MQRRHHYAADLARPARRAVRVQYFYQRAFVLDMIILALGALQGDLAGLLGAVHIGDFDIPQTPTFFAQGRVEHFRKRLHFA